MFSSRTVLPKVLDVIELGRAIVSARRRRNWLVLLLASSMLIGASVVVAARWGKVERQARGRAVTAMPEMTIPSASASHLVRKIATVPFETVTTISAAAYGNVPFVAPESIVAAFGLQLASQTVIATDADPKTPGIQLPTDLAGTSVEVNGRKAGLFFVSPGQVNYVIPAATAVGTANVVVKAGSTISTGTVEIVPVAPAIFTANSSGKDVPAALILRASSSGQTYEPLSQFSGGKYITKPINLGPASDLVFLVMYVTGVRQAEADEFGNLNPNIRVLIGGNEITPPYVAPLTQFVGLEQVNVLIPRSLVGRGIVKVSVVALGYGTSNVVDIEIAGTGITGASPPIVDNPSGMALAGQEFTVNGNNFSPIKGENEVKIAGRPPATVNAATTTQLKVMAPYGIESGPISVRTNQGEGKSAGDLLVTTSISGVVENTARVPLPNVVLRVCNPTPQNPNAECEPLGTPRTTDNDGVFVLPNIPVGRTLYIEVDGGVIQTAPPYPKRVITIIPQGNRDNQAGYVSLQQSTGGSGTVGGSSLTGGNMAFQKQGATSPPTPLPIIIKTGDFQLQVPAGTVVTTPTGGNTATLVLTQLQNSRAPAPLPLGYFSNSIVQITPFNVKLDPGAKLIFPNTDGFPAGMPLVLFRYDQESGKFLQEKSAVTVSADGQRIETEANAIKITSYYFASTIRNTTTITGRVFDADGKPLPNASARFRGQEALTDGDGSYVLRYVPVEDREMITVEVSSSRTSSRVDRFLSLPVPAIIGGITKVPDVAITKINRPPNILVAPKLEIDAGKTFSLPIVVTDPDLGQTVTKVEVSGASFASIIPLPSAPGAYLLSLAPGIDQGGEYTLAITAEDNLGAKATVNVLLFVKGESGKPIANTQAVMIDEDTMANILLEGRDPNGKKLTFKVTSLPTNGTLSGDAPNLTYKPGLNFYGADIFQFVANNGAFDSEPAIVAIIVRPVNDPPILTVPATQTINKGQLLSFAVLAADPDIGDRLTIAATSTLPEGASLTPVTATSSQFRWTPAQAGNFTIGFKVTDSGSPALSDTKDVRITVNDVSLLSVPNTQVISEGQPLSFDVAVIQNTTGAVTITATGLPQGATFPGNATNSGRLQWTPDFTQSGVYNVSFKATVAGTTPLTETKQVQIKVLDVVHDLAKESASVTIWGAAGKLPQALSDDGDLLGASMATGDLNGDGIPDLAVGAPGANGVGFDNGKVYVFFGRANWAGSIDLAQQKADVEILGEVAGDRFGASLAIADLNGDGQNDLIIGAPMADGSGLTDAGKVYVLLGNLVAVNDSISKLASQTITGEQRSEGFGTSLAAGFIHTKTGPAADLIVGAPGYDAPSTSATLSDVGAAYFFFGTSQLSRTIELSKTPSSYKVTGTFTGGLVGTKVAVGNFNGDEYADFAISAPLANASGLKSSGAVFLGLGGPTISGEKNTSQASSLILFGGREGDLLGTSLVMGDLNGDGKADLVLAAIGAGGPGNSRQGAGNVYVMYGSATLQGRPPDLTIFGSSANGDVIPDALGTSLAIGDFNGDGIVDLIIGAPGADNLDQKRDPVGAVYVIYGARTGLTGVYDLATKPADWTAWGARSGDSLGLGSIAVANINASEPADIILGIPRSFSLNNARTNAGEVRIVFGIR